jgi:hypothetical protein
MQDLTRFGLTVVGAPVAVAIIGLLVGLIARGISRRGH